MMKYFEGKSLAHPGCLIGITLGLSLGIVLAWLLAVFFAQSLPVILTVWALLTILLGALGWIIGNAKSSLK